jgi:hypothetical protein
MRGGTLRPCHGSGGRRRRCGDYTQDLTGDIEKKEDTWRDETGKYLPKLCTPYEQTGRPALKWLEEEKNTYEPGLSAGITKRQPDPTIDTEPTRKEK